MEHRFRKRRSLLLALFVLIDSHSAFQTAKAFRNISSNRNNNIANIIDTSIRMSSSTEWVLGNDDQAKEAKEELEIWPLDEHNVKLLNEVHPRNFVTSMEDAPHPEYDLIAIGSGAGGLVSSKVSCL